MMFSARPVASATEVLVMETPFLPGDGEGSRIGVVDHPSGGGGRRRQPHLLCRR